ncbi:hypothetical protein V6Z12_D06G202500 [Gossypium hirsutum]
MLINISGGWLKIWRRNQRLNYVKGQLLVLRSHVLRFL